MKKKILIVCRGFYPDISPRSFRATELAKEFSSQGHDVIVLTINRGDVYSDLITGYPGLRIVSIPGLKLKALEITGPKYLSLAKRGINRALLQLFEYPGMELSFRISRALKEFNGYDLLISIAVPHMVHWGVAKAWDTNRRIARVWIADCGDPYMGEATDSFRKTFYFKYVEKWFMRKADIITIPIESAIDAYYPEFHHKIRIVPQGYSFNNKTVKQIHKTNLFPTFAYAGSFIPGVRDPREFLKYLLKKKEKFRFEIFTSVQGYITDLAEISEGRIVLRDLVPRETLFKEFERMDFLVNFDNNTTIHSPSKLVDYALSGLPVLNITKEPDTKAIDSFLLGDYSSRLIINDIEKYNIKNVANQFLNIAGDIVS